MGFGALAFFLFSVFSSVIDFIPGSKTLRPSLITAIVGLLMVALSGRAGALIRHKVSMAFIALTLWFVACTPFSVWPGGAAATITGSWLVTLLSLFLAGGLIWNSDQCRKIVHLIGYSAILLSLIALALNKQSIEGRLFLPGSRWENSNNLAMVLLVTLPFLGFMALRRGNGLRRPLAMLGFAPMLLAIAETGSRSAMIGASVAVLVVFLSVSPGQKLKLLLAGIAVFAVLVAALPSHLKQRFFTVFGDSNSQMDSRIESSIESAQSRRMLLMDSITLTFRHPVFGVGPGNFPVAQNDLAMARGQATGNWHVTHNTYTQLSSESGLPGLVLFLVAIFFTVQSISRSVRLPVAAGSVAGRDIHAMAFALRVSLMAFLSCAVFDSMAYLPTVTILSGLAISLEFCAKSLLPAATPPASPLRVQQTVRSSPVYPAPYRPSPFRPSPFHPSPVRPVQALSGRQLPNRV